MTGTSAVVALQPDDIKRLTDVFPRVAGRGGDVAELARAAGVSEAAAQFAVTDSDTALKLQDAQTAAEDDGTLLKPVAARLTLAMLQKLRGELDSGALDADDIGNLLPKVHKVVEHADRMEAAQGNDTDKLPTVHITFINGGGVQVRAVAPADVVDIEAREVSDE